MSILHLYRGFSFSCNAVISCWIIYIVATAKTSYFQAFSVSLLLLLALNVISTFCILLQTRSYRKPGKHSRILDEQEIGAAVYRPFKKGKAIVAFNLLSSGLFAALLIMALTLVTVNMEQASGFSAWRRTVVLVMVMCFIFQLIYDVWILEMWKRSQLID